MLSKIYYIMVFIVVSIIIQSCSFRLIDEAAIIKTEKSIMEQEISIGKKVEGKEYFPYLLGYNIQGAIDEAFENAGENYDMLINTSVDTKHYYFIIYFSQYVVVKGTAVNSNELRKSMGDEKYSQWISQQNVIYKNVAENR